MFLWILVCALGAFFITLECIRSKNNALSLFDVVMDDPRKMGDFVPSSDPTNLWRTYSPHSPHPLPQQPSPLSHVPSLRLSIPPPQSPIPSPSAAALAGFSPDEEHLFKFV